MAEHRSDALQVFGVMPEIDKLYGGRFRLTFRCDTKGNVEEWYYSNKDNLFAEFGTLMDAGFGSSPATPDPDSTWPDQRLVEHGLEYLQGKDTPIVKFVYETLTDTWEKEDEDKPSSTENGLRLLTRQVVSAPGTAAPYDEDDVGVETITSAGKTLYLAGFQDDSDDRIGRFITRWAEAGVLSFGFSFDLEGLRTNRYRFLVLEGTTVGTLVSKETNNFDGLRTMDVTTVSKRDGTAFTDGEEVESFSVKYPFTYPGVAQCKFQFLGSTRGVYYLDLDPSITADVDATVAVNYQTSSSIGTLPETYWNPTSWAKFTAFWLTNNLEPTSVVKGLNQYRVGDSASQIYVGGLTQVAFLDRFVYAIAGVSIATMSLSGGPEDPSGNTYVIDRPKVEAAFVAEDGTQWYKRTIVTATV